MANKSQQEPGLPRSYLIKGCQQSLGGQWKIKKTLGQGPGAELPFRLLPEQELRTHVSTF